MAEKELASLLGQVETAKVDIVKELKDSHAFVDSCAEYYGVGFDDCLKQVKSNYLDLDLVKVSMDAPLPTILASDVVLEKTDDSTDSDQGTQDNGIILAQPAMNPPVIPLTPLDNPLAADDPLAQDAPDLSLQGDKAPQDPPTS